LELAPPSREGLPQCAAALAKRWPPNNLRDVSDEQIVAIGKDPRRFFMTL
jgi:hypothetical protein